MSIFNFELEKEAPKEPVVPWDIKVMLELYLTSKLAPKEVPVTLTALHLQGHTGITEAVLNKLRQLFLRLAHPNKSKVKENLQRLMEIIDAAIEEERAITDEMALKINLLLGPDFRISKSSLKTIEFLVRLGYCVNGDIV